jgi:pimeloyl-ACP methyl ester carboxylesterase
MASICKKSLIRKDSSIALAAFIALSLSITSSALAPRNGQQTKKSAVAAASIPSPTASSIRVGSLTLTHCADAPAFCGTLTRPLDPAGEVRGTIVIGFEYYPRTNQSLPALGTIVATEGGPGYATTGSRAGYIGLFHTLMDRRNLLLVDNRGTGTSQAIDCEPLQQYPFLALPRIAACGAYLGTTSDLYGSGLAADDLDAVLDALAIEQIDLYGDSYGTFFSQAFAGRHPERLRSLVLDSAWPVVGQSPWYPEAAPAMRESFEAACERSLVCQNLPGTASQRFELLLESLRQHPFWGQAHDGAGNLVNVYADPAALAFVGYSNSTGPIVYRETDAAARAYLEQGDSAPLLRLFAENYAVAPAGAGDDQAVEYSAGIFIAVSCTDYDQLYDMTASTTTRWIQRNAAFAAEEAADPGVYAPFTLDEFNSIPLDYSVFDACLNWPIPSPAHPPGQPAGPNPNFTTAPVLVLSGEMDTTTPNGQGLEATALFSNAAHVLVFNSTHVTAVGDANGCASVLVLNLVQNLNPGNTSCASQIPEIRTVPNFAQAASQLAPATALSGNEGTSEDLQVAAAAVEAAGDAIARWWMNYSGTGVGLRGGTFQYTGNNITSFTLTGYKFTNDVAVTGTMVWNFSSGQISANLSVTGLASESGNLQISWSGTQTHAQATIAGSIAGRHIAATMYAP